MAPTCQTQTRYSKPFVDDLCVHGLTCIARPSVESQCCAWQRMFASGDGPIACLVPLSAFSLRRGRARRFRSAAVVRIAHWLRKQLSVHAHCRPGKFAGRASVRQRTVTLPRKYYHPRMDCRAWPFDSQTLHVRIFQYCRKTHSDAPWTERFGSSDARFRK